MSFLDRLVFQPRRGRSRDLATLDFGFEETWLEAEDGVRLHAFWLPQARASEGSADRAVLFLHGNAGDATRRLPNADRLRRLGADVLLLDYRGYGRSEGRPTEAGIYADARAALDHLTKQRGLASGRIVVFGSSLGSAVAVDLARGKELAGLVVESGFPDMAAIARSFIGIGFQRWLGSKLASAPKIAELRCPLLFIHGGRDRVIRPALGRALHDTAPDPKAFYVVPGARHHDAPRVGGDAYFERIGRFLDEVAPPGKLAS